MVVFYKNLICHQQIANIINCCCYKLNNTYTYIIFTYALNQNKLEYHEFVCIFLTVRYASHTISKFNFNLYYYNNILYIYTANYLNLIEIELNIKL